MANDVKLKICGLTKEAEIPFINEYRPDYVGYVFAESKRKIDRATAELFNSKLESGIQTVGVFVDEDNDNVVELLNNNVIDIAQLHGNETEDDVRYIKAKTGKPVIKAVIMKDTTDVEKWRDTAADFLLLDSGKGSGKTFDWKFIKEMSKPFFLAGGINPDNVADAVKDVHPYCIDVSSGVEKNGMKDYELITELVNNMR